MIVRKSLHLSGVNRERFHPISFSIWSRTLLELLGWKIALGCLGTDEPFAPPIHLDVPHYLTEIGRAIVFQDPKRQTVSRKTRAVVFRPLPVPRSSRGSISCWFDLLLLGLQATGKPNEPNRGHCRIIRRCGRRPWADSRTVDLQLPALNGQLLSLVRVYTFSISSSFSST